MPSSRFKLCKHPAAYTRREAKELALMLQYGAHVQWTDEHGAEWRLVGMSPTFRRTPHGHPQPAGRQGG